MFTNGTQSLKDSMIINEVTCKRIIDDIAIWDEVVEKATLHLISRKEIISIQSIVAELSLMGYDVSIHEAALRHLIIKDVRKVIEKVTIL